MYTEKDNALLSRLLQSAREGKTDWLPTAHDNIFTTSVSGKYSFQIYRVPGPGPLKFALQIHDEGGNVIHRLSSEDYGGLEELYELARRRALKIDDTINDILAELDNQ